MEFVCYSDWQQLPASTDTLFAQAERRSIFCSRPWFENLAATTLEDNQSLLLACVVDAGRVRALLPLVRQAGGVLSALSHRYTSMFTLLHAGDLNAEICACLAAGLQQLSPHSVRLEPLGEDDSGIRDLQQALAASGFACHHSFRFYNWIHHTGGQSFADYLAARPARLRNTIVRKQRKLAREPGCELRLISGTGVPDAMADYHAVYNASWKAREQYRELLDGMVAGFSARGWSRLGLLYIAGQPAAAQLWFVAHGKASIFRLAHDEASKAWSPGSILTAYMMEHVIDTDRVGEIDFIIGNEAYKRDWMTTRRERFALTFATERTAGNELEASGGTLRGYIRGLGRHLAGRRSRG